MIKQMTSQELLRYDGRRRRAAEAVKKLGQGAQSKIAYDLRIPASQVSNALSGKYVHPKTLDRIESWLAGKGEPASAAPEPAAL